MSLINGVSAIGSHAWIKKSLCSCWSWNTWSCNKNLQPHAAQTINRHSAEHRLSLETKCNKLKWWDVWLSLRGKSRLFYEYCLFMVRFCFCWSVSVDTTLQRLHTGYILWYSQYSVSSGGSYKMKLKEGSTERKSTITKCLLLHGFINSTVRLPGSGHRF